MGMENFKAFLQIFDKVIGKIVAYCLDVVFAYFYLLPYLVCISTAVYFAGCIIVFITEKIVERIKKHKHTA